MSRNVTCPYCGETFPPRYYHNFHVPCPSPKGDANPPAFVRLMTAYGDEKVHAFVETDPTYRFHSGPPITSLCGLTLPRSRNRWGWMTEQVRCKTCTKAADKYTDTGSEKRR